MAGADEESRYWLVVASRYPQKLWISESGEYVNDTAVFSAIPD